MKKIIRKWGNSYLITFTSEDIEILGIEEGDVVDISDMVIQKTEKEV